MTEDELRKALAEGNAQFVPKEATPDPKIPPLDEMAKFTGIFEMLRKPKYEVTTAPTFIPKSFIEQIQFYDDGVNRRLYLYVNGTWRYVTLT